MTCHEVKAWAAGLAWPALSLLTLWPHCVACPQPPHSGISAAQAQHLESHMACCSVQSSLARYVWGQAFCQLAPYWTLTPCRSPCRGSCSEQQSWTTARSRQAVDHYQQGGPLASLAQSRSTCPRAAPSVTLKCPSGRGHRAGQACEQTGVSCRG